MPAIEILTNSGLSFPELREIARTEPKISIDDPRSHTSVTEVRTHGNFFGRFVELKAVRERKSDESVTYIRMVKERFAVDLLDFYDRNLELCETINQLILKQKPYGELCEGRSNLTRLEAIGALPFGKVLELERATEHPLGIDAIGLYYWDDINPLLENAYTRLDEITLNAPFLCR